ncbi:hypothetical protein [Parvularcula lutaonensis]|uniref:PEGA domain-containing protein n=1 Tax=Parvularcula lutaonensis TaxID=491923 RepID=A0ABV7M932_9PROT|nr:hypothetical protein [Parvularcula lutaonensis]GGY43588.1 hypothetical protein GCM10007148_10460 [Parvularcula lutaonensis]
MRSIGIAAVLVLLAACETTGLPEGLAIARPNRNAAPGTIIQTIPSGATLIYPDGECLTPCRVDYSREIEVILGKAGYKPLALTIPVGAADAEFELEPVGRSTAVQEESLPEL